MNTHTSLKFIIIILILLQNSCSKSYIKGLVAALKSSSDVSFSDTSVEFSSSQFLEITNSGETKAMDFTATIDGSSFSYTGGSFPGTGGTCEDNLEGYDTTCLLSIDFSPATGGAKSSSLNISFDNGTSTTSYSVNLYGVGIAQGSPDTTFSSDGKTSYDNGDSEFITTLFQDSDSKFLFVGQSDGGGSGDDEILLGRLLSDGSLDTSYGNSGFTLLDSGTDKDDVVNGAQFQSDDKFIIAGSIDTAAALFRVNKSGTFDTSFGLLLNGISAFTSFTLLSTDILFGVSQLSDSRYIAYGETDPLVGDSDFVVIRTTSAGIIDLLGTPTFGDITTPGQKVLDFGSDDRALTGFVLDSGKIFVAGYTNSGASRNSAFALLTSSGSGDGGFGTGGLLSTDICGAADADEVKAATSLSTGEFLLTGYCTQAGTGKDVFVAKRNSDGTPDISFGGGTGRTIIDISGNDDEATNILIQSNNQILVTGHSDSGVDTDFLIIRLESDGSTDTSFGTNGVVTTDISGNDTSYSSLLQSDGKIVLGGGAQGDSDIAATRNFP